METLTVMALLIIITGTMGAMAYNSRRITDDIKQRTRQQFRQLQIESLIREAAEGISVPYWQQPEPDLPTVKNTIEKTLSNAGYKDSFKLETLYDNAGRPRGILCRYHIGGREFESRGLFASIPLGGVYK